mmetsp:Transcript_8611/g.10735  ORF Transcript_8611/g.10735 Transcript_8611/m.10735 type:complete len:922 (-) Transcript_8611:5931-8696(-)
MTSRKRHRISVVCGFCKKRKVKCDKGNPCSTCLKYGNLECHYDIHGVDIVSNKTTDAEDIVHGELKILKAKIRNLEESLTTSNESNNEEPSSNNSNKKVLNQVPLNLENGISCFGGYNPVASLDDTINFYEGYTAVFDSEPVKRRNFGPLAWLSLIKVDPALTMLWSFIHSKKMAKLKPCAVDDNANCTSPEKQFRERENNDAGINDVTLYEDAPQSQLFNPKLISNCSNNRNKLNEKAMSLGLTFYDGGIDEELKLIEKIELVLPNKRIIWKLIERFFTHLYPFFAIIDELYFKLLISRLLGPESFDEEKISKLKVEKRLDFAYLGLLLIVLRLSYLSLFSNITTLNEAKLYSNDPSPKAREFRYLLNNPINIDVIDVAQLCLNQFNLLRKGNMAIMQLAVFTRLYHMYAPEDGDGSDGGDSQVFTGMLIQMAISMGLNREPDNFPDKFKDEKTNNLGRKIWYLLLINDINNAMAMGYPMSTSIEIFDTKVPYYKDGNANINDIELEKSVTSSFGRIDAIYEPMSKLLKKILNVRDNINMEDLTASLSDLERSYMNEYCDLRKSLKNEILSKSDVVKKTLKMKIYFTCHFFRVSLFFHFYNYYERKSNYDMSFFYLKKIFLITILDLMPFYNEILESNHLVFRNSTDLVITPSFELAIHKSIVVLIATLIKVKLTILDFELSYNHEERILNDVSYNLHFKKLERFFKLLDKSSKVFLDSISRLSSRYYFSWRISKAQYFLMDTVLSKEFYDKNIGKSKDCLIRFTSPMLDELINIFEDSLASIKEKRHRHKQTDTTGVPDSVPSFDNDTRNGSTDSASYYSDNSSNDFGTNDFIQNDQIDSLWLNMMSMKNENATPGSQFKYNQPDNVTLNPGIGEFNNIPNYASFGYNDNTNGDPGHMNNSEFDIFETFPLDELFKNLN